MVFGGVWLQFNRVARWGMSYGQKNFKRGCGLVPKTVNKLEYCRRAKPCLFISLKEPQRVMNIAFVIAPNLCNARRYII